MVNHEFTEDWGRRMEEILVPVGSLRMEEPSSEARGQKGNRGEARTPKVKKPTFNCNIKMTFKMDYVKVYIQ